MCWRHVRFCAFNRLFVCVLHSCGLPFILNSPFYFPFFSFSIDLVFCISSTHCTDMLVPTTVVSLVSVPTSGHQTSVFARRFRLNSTSVSPRYVVSHRASPQYLLVLACPTLSGWPGGAELEKPWLCLPATLKGKSKWTSVSKSLSGNSFLTDQLAKLKRAGANDHVSTWQLNYTTGS